MIHCSSIYIFGIIVVTMIMMLMMQVQAFVPTKATFGIRSTRQVFLSNNAKSTTTTTTTTTIHRFVSSQDRFDMDELRQRIQDQNHPFSDLFGSSINEQQQKQQRPEQVHVIVFHPGSDQQGAHTIEYPKNSGNNILLAFTSYDACQKFAKQLEKQSGFCHATPQQYQFKELMIVCDQLGVYVQVVPEDVELIPPVQNVKTFGHDPELRKSKNYLDYVFEMSEDDDDDDDDDDWNDDIDINNDNEMWSVQQWHEEQSSSGGQTTSSVSLDEMENDNDVDAWQ